MNFQNFHVNIFMGKNNIDEYHGPLLEILVCPRTKITTLYWLLTCQNIRSCATKIDRFLSQTPKTFSFFMKNPYPYITMGLIFKILWDALYTSLGKFWKLRMGPFFRNLILETNYPWTYSVSLELPAVPGGGRGYSHFKTYADVPQFRVIFLKEIPKHGSYFSWKNP